MQAKDIIITDDFYTFTIRTAVLERTPLKNTPEISVFAAPVFIKGENGREAELYKLINGKAPLIPASIPSDGFILSGYYYVGEGRFSSKTALGSGETISANEMIEQLSAKGLKLSRQVAKSITSALDSPSLENLKNANEQQNIKAQKLEQYRQPKPQKKQQSDGWTGNLERLRGDENGEYRWFRY